MKKIISALAFVGVALTLLAGPALAQQKMSGLRSDADFTKPDKAPEQAKVLIPDDPAFPRSFKEQPPLIPHKIDKYRISLKENKCLSCHDLDKYKEEKAPKIGDSHYIGADGKPSNKISMRRYFCEQCHVPQFDAKALVENTFVGVPVKN